MLSCLVLIVTGFMMRFIASRVSPDQGGATLALAVIAANCVNYASLIALIAAVDNGFHKIKTIANSIAVFQVIMFGQDIALHVLYQLAVCDHHNIDACNAAKAHGCLGPPADTAAQVKLCAPCKPFSCYDQRVGDARFGERFTTLRLASLATLILLRVKVTPRCCCCYCSHVLHLWLSPSLRSTPSSSSRPRSPTSHTAWR